MPPDLADYSQVELRLLPIYDEPVLKEIFRRGEDVHTATAEAISAEKPSGDSLQGQDGQLRDRLRPAAFASRYRSDSPEEAQEFIDRYLERFPRLKAFIDRRSSARARGHVATLFGRIRVCPTALAEFQTRSLG